MHYSVIVNALQVLSQFHLVILTDLETRPCMYMLYENLFSHHVILHRLSCLQNRIINFSCKDMLYCIFTKTQMPRLRNDVSKGLIYKNSVHKNINYTFYYVK
ncbi:hypothetical protein XELAEV_18006635mg [Xenopus laevis]|uniref:Uncharacterized protein n=1 Tax=Xenopus laevis TaxID=8355 RepID=A0A974E1D9_XENLA|nr:hypothetical protein XELAEV_18006635mg [Xenopus laevis]